MKLLIILYWFLIGVLSIPLLMIILATTSLILLGTIIGGIISILKNRIDKLELIYFEKMIIKKD